MARVKDTYRPAEGTTLENLVRQATEAAGKGVSGLAEMTSIYEEIQRFQKWQAKQPRVFDPDLTIQGLLDSMGVSLDARLRKEGKNGKPGDPKTSGRVAVLQSPEEGIILEIVAKRATEADDDAE